ncbi:MAG: hypothetical protein D6797_09540 [Bdellovibrio sp.]|nr:MAG: hypothetical protein D6797_09540 [Bdellovibrio sp.]
MAKIQQRLLLIAFIFLLGIRPSLSAPSAVAGDSFSGDKPEITIMTYNVENLFDTEHDRGKDDWDFLPKNYPGKKSGCARKSPNYRFRCLKSDWTPDKLQIKLRQIKKMVTYSNGLPDILAVQEIENENVARMLSDTLGFNRFILEEGPDRRGIDVALFFNEDKVTYLTHRIWTLRGDSFEKHPSRDILGVYFEFPKGDKMSVLAVYVNHWPSQRAPSMKRVMAAQQLKKFLEEDRRKYGSAFHAVVLGDFNTVNRDWPHPINSVLLNPSWIHHLIDVQSLAKKYGYYKANSPLGSYFYPPRMEWSFLDRVLISQNLHDAKGLEASLKSFSVISPKFAKRAFRYTRSESALRGSMVMGVPIRYNHNASDIRKAGYSDHFPISVKIRYR